MPILPPHHHVLSANVQAALAQARSELLEGVRHGILPFWRVRAIDEEHGGYFTSFDGDGNRMNADGAKQLVTQARLVWVFSRFAGFAEDPALLDLARHGVRFLERHFLDREHGGWRWRVARDGTSLDDAKIVYGQAFALYAFAAFARATGDEGARRHAEQTFGWIQGAADIARGGYYENLTRDWHLADGGSAAGDRKSLDTHMHLLEAFTELVLLTKRPVHARSLRDVSELIRRRMVDNKEGFGGNQYSLDLMPVPPIAIERTWTAERPGADAEAAAPVDLTSYGHNLELAWLLAEADRALDESGASDRTIAMLCAHTLRNGYDRGHGGVFRVGLGRGDPIDDDKEFWQNSEALAGFLEGYRVTGDPEYVEAFLGTWRFARAHLVHPTFGEWRIRTSVAGDPVVTDLGNEWKNAYHTGRAALETARRVDAISGRLDERKMTGDVPAVADG